MLDNVLQSYKEHLTEQNKIPIKDRLRSLPDSSLQIVRLQLNADPTFGIYPHFGVVIHTGENLAMVSVQTNIEWLIQDKAQGYLYCHPTITTITNKEDNLLNRTLPAFDSPTFNLELNQRIFFRLAKISNAMITGRRSYHATRFNCEKFVKYLITEQEVTEEIE